MKVATTLVIASLFMIAAGSASAESGLEEEGSILVGVSEVVVQDLTSPCDPDAPDNGVFGVWYDVDGEGGNRYDIEVAATLDADPRFYDANCDFIGHGGAQLGFLGAAEGGNIPSDAAFLLVYGYAGSGDFTLTIS